LILSLATTLPDLIHETEEEKIPFPPTDTDLAQDGPNLRELLGNQKLYASKTFTDVCLFFLSSYDLPRFKDPLTYS
jgi:hypothetical protein